VASASALDLVRHVEPCEIAGEERARRRGTALAFIRVMRLLRSLLTAAVPIGLALAAFLHASALAALVEGTVSGASLGASPGSSEAARAGEVSAGGPGPRLRATLGADAILDRNPFDHLTGALRPLPCASTAQGCGRAEAVRDDDPANAPACEGVRPLVIVGHEDQAVAFAALEVGGERLLRRRGGEVGARRVAHVGRDRVWLSGERGLCQARLFGPPPPALPPVGGAAEGAPRATAEPTPRSALELEIAKRIARTGPNEFQIERGAVDRILEAQQELMKSRLVPDKEGDRVVGMKIFAIKPGSVLGMLGIENGDRLETINGFEVGDPEKMLEAYARLRTGADRLTVHLTRAGKPINVDYTIR
jgi:general secretion pathway protein C